MYESCTMSSIPELAELIFPVRCISCSALGIKLCTQCRKSWIPHIYRTSFSGEIRLNAFSAVQYSLIAKKILIASKETGLKLADTLIEDSLQTVIKDVLAHDWVDFIVPIPSRKAAARSRGRQFVFDVASNAASPFSIPVFDVLSHTRIIRDQSSLKSAERFKNLSGAFTVKSHHPGRALLVDDLVTTGATLQEAARALKAGGFEVACAVTACVAKPLE